MQYLNNRLTDFDEICMMMHAALSGRSATFFENKRWRTATDLKIEKLRYLRNYLVDYEEILHDDAQ